VNSATCVHFGLAYDDRNYGFVSMMSLVEFRIGFVYSYVCIMECIVFRSVHSLKKHEWVGIHCLQSKSPGPKSRKLKYLAIGFFIFNIFDPHFLARTSSHIITFNFSLLCTCCRGTHTFTSRLRFFLLPHQSR